MNSSTDKDTIVTNAPAPQLKGKVHTMPDYYIPKSKASNNPKALIIGGGAFVALSVIVVVVFFLTSSPSTEPIQEQTAPIVAQEPSAPTPSESVETPEAPTEQEEIEPEQEEVVVVQNVPLPPTIQAGAAADNDKDGLTDIEEALFVTNAAKPDTDDDTFLDGVELANLYDPAVPTALLETSDRIKIVQNEPIRYQFLLPSSWSSLVSPDGKLVTITPDQGTEELSLQIFDNPNRLTVTRWYQEQVPGISLTDFTSFTNEAGWSGIKTLDGRLVIATYGNTEPGARAFVFVMLYDVVNEQIIRYPTIWEMITNSLDVLEQVDE